MGQKLPFGTWLVSQHSRNDAIGALAKAARQDPRFPLNGDAQAVSLLLNKNQADWEMHDALERAELDWAAF